MKQFVFLVLLSLICNIMSGQSRVDRITKSKGDSVLRAWVGNGIKRVSLKFKEAHHHNTGHWVCYFITFPENNYSGQLIIHFDKAYNVADSNFFRAFPDYVLEDRPNDLISKDSAFAIAKRSGLCLDDILEIDFYRNYRARDFVWVFHTDNKKKRQQYASLRIRKRNTTKTKCETRSINAKTGGLMLMN